MLRSLVLIRTLIVLFAALSFNCIATPSLWKVSNGQQQWYLFGSIHLGKASYYPLPDTYYRALDNAERLIVELDPSTVGRQQQQAMFRRGSLAPSDSVQQYVSTQHWQQLEQILAKLGLPAAQAQHLQPWYLTVVLGQISMQQLGFSGEYGLDNHFIKHAQQQGLPLIALENFEQQLQALSTLETIQVPLLEQTIDDFERFPYLLDQMEQYWLNGQNHELYTLLADDPMFQQQSQAVIEALLFTRNRSWVQQLQQQTGTSFVVVGALHLYGEHGLLAAFKQLGYTIQAVTAEEGFEPSPPSFTLKPT